MRTQHRNTIQWLGVAAVVIALGTPAPSDAAQAAASPAARPALAVQVVSVTTPVVRGQQGQLVVKTAPSANCGASVQSQSDPGRTIASLPRQTANSGGLVTWTVRVPGLAKPGPYPVTVTCQRNGATSSTHFSVTVK